ncbi:MAG TPA: MBOAT family protein [Rhizomicrobium sp.]|nr:MBOAT family protein [Rhizomicrobium sp.]
MPFNSYPYIAFIVLAVLAFLFLELRFPRARRPYLLLLSYVFYAWWRADFVLLVIGSTIVNYTIGTEITRRHAAGRATQALLLAGLAFNLGLISLFKYDDLFVGTTNAVFGTGFPLPHFFLPLAISFFTFEQISYLVDASQGKAKLYSFLDFALFVAFFPHLIAGPIVRYNDLIPQFHETRNGETRDMDIATGATLFTFGLAKKTLIADNLAPFADAIFGGAQHGIALGFADAWLGTLFFAFQIYFDFSAYTDMALGSACMFGIRLPFNFNSPYKAASIIEFWRRWHISLSTFLRDYLYISLGGNRQGAARRYLNLFITMLLGGLWHGANWTFMIWGGLHGTYLIINHAWRAAVERFGWRAPSGAQGAAHAFAVLLTFAATTFAWVVFRAPTFDSAVNVLRGLAGIGGDSHLVTFSPLAGVAIVALFAIVWFAPNTMELLWPYRPALEPPRGTSQVRVLRGTWSPTRRNAIVVGTLCVAAVLALSNLSPFIYFQF